MPLSDPSLFDTDPDRAYAEIFEGTGSILEDPMARDACRAFEIGNSSSGLPPGLSPKEQHEMSGDIYAMRSQLQSSFRAKWKDRLAHADPWSPEARAVSPNAVQAAATQEQLSNEQETPMPIDPNIVEIRCSLRAKGYSDEAIDAAIAYQPGTTPPTQPRSTPTAQVTPAPATRPRAGRADDAEVTRRMIAKGFSAEEIKAAFELPTVIVRDLGVGVGSDE